MAQWQVLTDAAPDLPASANLAGTSHAAAFSLNKHDVMLSTLLQEAVRVAQQHGDAEALTQALAGLCQLLMTLAPGQDASSEADADPSFTTAPEPGHLQSLLRRSVDLVYQADLLKQVGGCRQQGWCRPQL